MTDATDDAISAFEARKREMTHHVSVTTADVPKRTDDWNLVDCPSCLRSKPDGADGMDETMTHTKYILPDGSSILAVSPGTTEPKPMLTLELSPGDALWSRGQRIPGTQRRFVLAEMALGL